MAQVLVKPFPSNERSSRWYASKTALTNVVPCDRLELLELAGLAGDVCDEDLQEALQRKGYQFELYFPATPKPAVRDHLKVVRAA